MDRHREPGIQSSALRTQFSIVDTSPSPLRFLRFQGVFGGLLPLIGLSSVAATGNIYAGLYYPMIVAGMTFIVGSLSLRDTKSTRIWAEAGGSASAAD
jgi:hypothetical protein